MEMVSFTARPSDLTTRIRLIDKANGATVTIGTISLEQTTPSIRFWQEFPVEIYNKPGRVRTFDMEVQKLLSERMPILFLIIYMLT